MKRAGWLCLCLAALAAGCRREGPAGLGPPGRAPVALDQEEGTATPPTLTNSVGMRLALIPAGAFLMGSADSDPAARADEKPRHRVRITRPFYLGVYEVTQAEYARVVGHNPSFFSTS